MPKKKSPFVWEPAPYDDEGAITSAIKALAAGNANEGQQQLALDWIVRVLCGTYDQPWQTDERGGDRATIFACAKQHVGQQIVKHIKITTSAKRSRTVS